MTRRYPCAALFLAAVLCSAPVFSAERPRLGVLLVVDQLSVAHFDARLPGATGGFRRLVAEGFRFRDARNRGAPALTALGHATIATGAYASVHGIVGNDWYDAALKRPVYVCEDPRYRILGREPVPGDGTAPSRMRAGTLGDALKAAYPEAKTVAIAGKDRAAMLLVGFSANAAVWMDHVVPRFTSSNVYGSALPAWVEPVNERLATVMTAGMQWSLPRGGFTGASPPAWATDVFGFGRSFPHVVNPKASALEQTEQILHTPLINDCLVDLALAAVQAEKLGADDVPDLLTVSFSTFDKVLHAFGPDSPEAAAVFSELDAQLTRLLAGLDQRVGKGKYVVALTADHGGMNVAEV